MPGEEREWRAAAGMEAWERPHRLGTQVMVQVMVPITSEEAAALNPDERKRLALERILTIVREAFDAEGR